MNKEKLQEVIKTAVGNVLSGHIEKPVQNTVAAVKSVLKEAVILMPKTFVMKGEVQSSTTKETHEKLYKSLVDTFNKISAKLDTAVRTEGGEGFDNDFRRLKTDETFNLNGVKLHELYFVNVGDMHSEIRADSIPFMRLTRDWGTFDQWQIDFRACGMVAREGWAVCYFDPFKQQYFNCFVEANNVGIPLMGIPVLVVDVHHHSWFYDYPGEKMDYLNKSMREINWSVVEMRMVLAEMAKMHQLYAIQPVISSEREHGVGMVDSSLPVEVLGGKQQ